MAGLPETVFKCTCTREFTQASAYTKHQHSCTKGKKQLFSALSKAKDLLGLVKWSRLSTTGHKQDVCAHTASSSSQVRSDAQILPPDIRLETSSTCIEDDGLPLAQRRSRHVGVPMPLRFKQYEDVLPQPPSVPSYTPRQPETGSPTNIVPARASSSVQATPFRTSRNIFGLVHQFFSSVLPSHDPEEAITLQDISYIPTLTAEDSDTVAIPLDNSFHLYPNESSFKLGHWYWNGGAQKSQQSFKELLDIIGHPDYDPDDVRHTHWDKINSQLGASVGDEGEEWEDEDAGWHKTQVTIDVPFCRTTAQPDICPYIAADLYHWSLVSVIWEKLASAHDNEYFHYEPYQLCWCPPHLPHEVNIQGELYTSPAFLDAHRELQELPGEAGCELPRVVAALMFWSDATQLTTFGNVKLWPVYMYFGNESKYRRCKPSCNLGNYVAYFQKLLDSFKDFAGIYTEGKGVGHECTTHCHRELFQAQWKILLDDKFLEAYEHGIVILCCDGIKRRFYPRIFTYSADYPEKVLVATIRQLGGCPCSRCLIPTNRLHCLGMAHDRAQLRKRSVVIMGYDTRSDVTRSQLVITACRQIYEKHYGVDSTVVEALLKPESWVPTPNILSDRLGRFGFNVFIALVVDLLHEFELGVWCMLLVHLLRILTSINKDLVHELDKRYRQVPPFGPATIRRFSSNTSDMSNMAARNFEDLLQCSIPVFDGLIPDDNHNKIVIELLFIMSHWHGLAKLHMHSDLTLSILDQQTTDLRAQFRLFKDQVCPSYQTQELDREVGARSRQQVKEAAKRAETVTGRARKGASIKGKEKATPEQPPDAPELKQPRRKKSFNFSTYKFHVLGDYVASIRHFGTTDSYSTEPGELEHRTPKGRYRRTDRRVFVRQLTQIERRIKQRQRPQTIHTDPSDIASDPKVHHHIGQSEKLFDEFGQYLRKHAGDPAIKDFLPQLKEHIVCRLRSEIAEPPMESPPEQHNILFRRNQIYHHNLARFNYTTYDVRRAQDVVNPRTPHCNIMLLKHDRIDGEREDNYLYAKVIGIHHVNVVLSANMHESRRIEFLLVRWYESVQSHTWDTGGLGRVHFRPLQSPMAFGFIDPGVVLRGCHVIPAFSRDQHNPGERGISPLAGDRYDWHEYYINSFVDRDTVMRFHYGLGVGHVYSHQANPSSTQDTPCPIAQTPTQTEDEDLDNGERNEAFDDEEDEEDDHVGAEELNFFDWGLSASTVSLSLALDNMFPIDHTFDYEN
ncbi:hypothetical protein C8R48DRAFT_587375 [Suillus tomentosus]|nr:hypothetical protein C8R48DRAFT_587375 [Suillus tomentosus]